MDIEILPTARECGRVAAAKAAALLRKAIDTHGQASFVVATGASQFDFLAALCNEPTIDWSKTTMYHLDEYIGLPEDHPASFRRYLRDRLVDRVKPGRVHFIQGDAENPEAECRRLNGIISGDRIHAAFIGIGENGHLAFNDPPADFETVEPYILVKLDEECRKQQLGEGWFPSLDAVPDRAVSMSIQQIMKSQAIVCTVPDERKARAVRDCLEGDVTPRHPASILRQHERVHLFLDRNSASLLKPSPM
jgi:glucosamine-6-phosphate deaminase